MELCWKEFREKEGKWVLSKVTKLSKEESQELIEEAKEKARRDHVAEIAWGRNKGREEGHSKAIKEMVIKLIKEGLENSVITRVTGRTEQEVINFKKKM